MRFKISALIGGGTQNDADWRCCLCCHVRTGTILLGIWHVILHLMSLAVIAVVILHPEFVDQLKNAHTASTHGPLTNISMSSVAVDGVSTHLDLTQNDPQPHVTHMNTKEPKESAKGSHLINSRLDYLGTYGEFSKRHRLNTDDLNAGMAITTCTFFVTLVMLYGAIKSRPSYLMPFFCLQVFDFFIASLTAIGYISYFPNIRGLVKDNPDLPFREQLLCLDPELVSMVILFAFIFTMGVKAYFIGVVWSCYKYLVLQSGPPSSNLFHLSDSESLLPDYDLVIADKQAMFPTPPPSYEIAVAVEAAAKEAEEGETTSSSGAASQIRLDSQYNI